MSDFTNILYYNNSDNFTASSEVEVTTVARLLDLTPTNALFWATYTTDEDGNCGDGTLTGTLLANAVISGGYLDCRASSNDGCSYDGDNLATASQAGAMKFKCRPGYVGTPTFALSMLELTHGTGGIDLLNKTDGSLELTVDNDDGTVGSKTASAALVWADQDYEILINWDVAGEVFSLYRDGTRIINITGVTLTRVNAFVSLIVGKTRVAGTSQAMKYSDVIFFSAVQETGATYTPGYTLAEGCYSNTPQSIIENAGIGADAIVSEAVSGYTTPANTFLKRVANVGGVDMWFNTTTSLWATSTGYAESNTFTEYDANIASLDLSPGSQYYRKLWLESTDGKYTPYATSISTDYDYFEGPDTQSSCLIKGYIDDNGTGVEGGTVSFNTYTPYGEGNNTTSINETATSRSNGYYEKSLVQGASVEAIMTWVDLSGKN